MVVRRKEVVHGAKELANKVEHRGEELTKKTDDKPSADATPPKAG